MLAEELCNIREKSIMEKKSKEFWEDNAKVSIKEIEEEIRKSALNGRGETSFYSKVFDTIEEANYVGKYFAERGCYVLITDLVYEHGYIIGRIKWKDVINGSRSFLQYIRGFERNGVYFHNSHYESGF